VYDDNDIPMGSLELVIAHREDERSREQQAAERAEAARSQADDARLALTSLAEPAVRVIAARLIGLEVDDENRKITKDREDTAWEVLSRIGVPRLRATAIAASISAFTHAPAPGSPGWVPPEVEDGEDGEDLELDPASVDAQIQAFLDGASAARKLRGDD
jgi:hypothetical protein